MAASKNSLFRGQGVEQKRAIQSDRVKSVVSYPHFTKIYAQGKVVGRVTHGVFEKSVIGSIHFLRKPPAISFDIDSLRQAERAGAYTLHIVDKETGKVYTTTMKKLLKRGFAFNRGFGKQIGLRLGEWDVD
jgi:hypothetical protein